MLTRRVILSRTSFAFLTLSCPQIHLRYLIRVDLMQNLSARQPLVLALLFLDNNRKNSLLLRRLLTYLRQPLSMVPLFHPLLIQIDLFTFNF
jgi:hypothetical protein